MFAPGPRRLLVCAVALWLGAAPVTCAQNLDPIQSIRFSAGGGATFMLGNGINAKSRLKRKVNETASTLDFFHRVNLGRGRQGHLGIGAVVPIQPLLLELRFRGYRFWFQNTVQKLREKIDGCKYHSSQCRLEIRSPEGASSTLTGTGLMGEARFLFPQAGPLRPYLFVGLGGFWVREVAASVEETKTLTVGGEDLVTAKTPYEVIFKGWAGMRENVGIGILTSLTDRLSLDVEAGWWTAKQDRAGEWVSTVPVSVGIEYGFDVE